ncbi:Nramp family divalent metal transporter [Hymenobacter psoromatis]|uniref:Nramp family divalent metal transporter n=1 Tax=Hymenobacter psoromatis TaxID=1484116 RepID=UPI0039FC0D23
MSPIVATPVADAVSAVPEPGWRHPRRGISLSEVHGSITVPGEGASFWQKFRAYWGPGLLVSVGYMDPGNWATDIAGGARFGYTLLSVVLLSNLFAMLLQHLAVKLGVVTGRDLAQACRDHYSKPVAMVLWVLCEIAIAACDLAEVIGSAIAFNLLFGLPITWGIALTTLDVLLILVLQSKGFRVIESIVMALIFTIFVCFLYEIIASHPDWLGLAGGLVPQPQIVSNPAMLYVAIGILGATVMPHNLYLHSAIVQVRQIEPTETGKRSAIKFATIDSTTALALAFFVNAAILVTAAAAFHGKGYDDVADIADAHKLLTPVLGASAASVVFAIALLASGQSSTLTGTLAGQVVMEGFLHIKLRPWLRRLVTRLLAVVPAFIVALYYGEKGTGQLLVLSQVILSLQLSFAVIPLVLFTNDKLKMGVFVNRPWLRITAWVVAGIILVLNGFLLYQTFAGNE